MKPSVVRIFQGRYMLQGGVEDVQYAINHKRKGRRSADAIRSARSASMMAPWQLPMRMHVIPSADWPTARSHDWRESGLFSRAKKSWKSTWRETMVSPLEEFSFSPLFSLFLFLSLSLSLSLPPFSLSLSLSLSFSSFLSPALSLTLSLSPSLSVSHLSLSLKGHTQKHCRVNAHPYGGPTVALTLHTTAFTWVGEIRWA